MLRTGKQYLEASRQKRHLPRSVLRDLVVCAVSSGCPGPNCSEAFQSRDNRIVTCSYFVHTFGFRTCPRIVCAVTCGTHPGGSARKRRSRALASGRLRAVVL
jgi:hypothetical protein